MRHSKFFKPKILYYFFPVTKSYIPTKIIIATQEQTWQTSLKMNVITIGYYYN